MADNSISNGEKYEYNPENKKGNYDSDIGYGSSSDIPERYCHVIYGNRSVRNEVYSLMHTMSSDVHMPKRQIQASILAVANILYKKDWNLYRIKGAVDSKTISSMNNILLTKPLFNHYLKLWHYVGLLMRS